ncbi:MAG: hypothetical protein P8K79_02550 [Mariniblastus sp.]|nr:hypothetical protein [Mariniblastus sp.]
MISYRQQVRCARCGKVSRPQTENASQRKPNRAARWSLWLGLSSILLLSITGIPALILGIRSLLQMRHEQPTKREKEAGVLGTLLGLVFGVLLGGCFLGGGGMILFAMLNLPLERSHDADVIRQWMDQVVQIDLPDGLEPSSARKQLGTQTLFEFDNFSQWPLLPGQSPSKFTSLSVIHFAKSPTFSLPLMKNELNRAQADWIVKLLKQGKQERLEWTLCGTPTEVIHTSYSAQTSPGSPSTPKADRYIAIVADDHAAVGLKLVTESKESMSTDEVRRIFESLKMVRD